MDWTTKRNYIDTYDAAHINALQTYKADKDSLPFITIEEKGAVGDGVTDDITAFAAAIASSTKPVIQLAPNKTYIISSPITVPSGYVVTFIGPNTFDFYTSPSTVIKLKAASNCDMLDVADGGYVNIVGICFDGNKANQSTGSLRGLDLAGTGILRSSIRDVIVKNIKGTGIYNTRREVTFDRVVIDACENDGFYSSATSDVYISDLLSGFNGDHGVHIVGNWHCLSVVNSYRNGDHGLYLHNANYNRVARSNFDSNDKNGICINADSTYYAAWNDFIQTTAHSSNYSGGGSYANVLLTGAGYAIDNRFVGVDFGYAESELSYKPGYGLQDSRSAYSSTPGYRTYLTTCRFAPSACYSVAEMTTDFQKYGILWGVMKGDGTSYGQETSLITTGGPTFDHIHTGKIFGADDVEISTNADGTRFIKIINSSTGSSARADFVALAPSGNGIYMVQLGDNHALANQAWLYTAGTSNVLVFGTIGTERVRITTDGKVGINDNAPGEYLDVNGNVNTTGVVKVDDTQVVSNRVVDERADDTINESAWDSTTAGVLDALRDAMIAHGLISAS